MPVLHYYLLADSRAEKEKGKKFDHELSGRRGKRLPFGLSGEKERKGRRKVAGILSKILRRKEGRDRLLFFFYFPHPALRGGQGGKKKGGKKEKWFFAGAKRKKKGDRTETDRILQCSRIRRD